MKLLIDIGNTRIKWATVSGDVIAGTGSVIHGNTGKDDAPPPIDKVLSQVLDEIDDKPDEVLAANVAGDTVGDAIDAAVRARWSQSVVFAKTRSEAGDLRNGYDDCRQMGVDRWLAMLAVRDRYRQAACVVDAGTAVTIDQIDGEGIHLGGVIVPGLDLMRRSLLRDTGDIERLGGIGNGSDVIDKRITVGRSTAEAIGGGPLSAICGLIEDCVEQLNGQYGGGQYGDSVLVMTGGDAERLMPHLRLKADHRPQLVLEGLNIYSRAG